MRVLSQSTSSSACERNWNTFALVHTKQRNRLAHSNLRKLVFCYYNMKLRLKDMEAAQDNVEEQDPLNLLDFLVEIGDEDEYPLFQWIRPIHLDDRNRNPNPQIIEHAREYGINVEQVMSEEVGLSSGTNSLDELMLPTSSGLGASSIIHNISGDDDDDDDDDDVTGDIGGGGDDGVNCGQHDQSQTPLNPFTCEEYFTHATQDEDHGSRRAGSSIRARAKKRKERMNQENIDDVVDYFSSMSVSTEQSSHGFGIGSSGDS